MMVFCGRCGCPFTSPGEKGRCPECNMNEWTEKPGPLTAGWKRRQKAAPPKKRKRGEKPSENQGTLWE